MRLSGLAYTASLLIVLSGCAPFEEGQFTQGDPNDCSGVVQEVLYGPLPVEPVAVCVEFSEQTVPARDILAFAGVTTEGTSTHGDLVICRVNGLPSATEDLIIEGQEPYRESCVDMPPAFAYWALWVRSEASAPWDYAQEGVGSLMVDRGSGLGLVFSTGGETPTPSDP